MCVFVRVPAQVCVGLQCTAHRTLSVLNAARGVLLFGVVGETAFNPQYLERELRARTWVRERALASARMSVREVERVYSTPHNNLWHSLLVCYSVREVTSFKADRRIVRRVIPAIIKCKGKSTCACTCA